MNLARRTSRPVSWALVLLLVGCASEPDGAPGDGGAQPSPSPDPGEAAIDIGSRTGPPGTNVRVEGSGFPAGAEIDVGFGPPRSEYDVIRTVQADPRGNVSVTVSVPSWAERDRTYVFVLAAPANDPRAVSEPFHVTGADGSVRIEGELTDEGVECPAVRSPLGTLYTLAGGDTEGLQAGDRVVVEGTVAEMSFCMQGITINATRVERR